MRTDPTRNSRKPGALRRLFLALLVTVVVLGVLGVVVTLAPRNVEPPGTEPREIPQARQIDRKSLR